MAALPDAEIDTSDSPPLDDSFFARATMRMPNRPSKNERVELTAAEIVGLRAGGAGVQMKKEQFKEFVESIKEAGKIHRGEMKASREFVFDPKTPRRVRLRSSSNDLEIINAHAAELNAEAEDVLSYQVIP